MLPNINIGTLSSELDVDSLLFMEHSLVIDAITNTPKIFTFDVEVNHKLNTITASGKHWKKDIQIGISVCGWKTGFYRDCLLSPNASHFVVSFKDIVDGFYDVVVIQNNVVIERKAVLVGDEFMMDVVRIDKGVVCITIDKAQDRDIIVAYRGIEAVSTKRILPKTKKFIWNVGYGGVFSFKYYRGIIDRVNKDTPYLSLKMLHL
ncbi:Uncharacterized protein QTN25_000474 [Entamoeba marina]